MQTRKTKATRQQRRPSRFARCRDCARVLKAHVPSMGDGTAVRVYRHKNGSGEPCDGHLDTLDDCVWALSFQEAEQSLLELESRRDRT